MKLWQKRMISASLRPLGSKSDPPLPPPSGMPVSAFLKVCSKPRNFTMPRYTEGWKRSPPLYGPRALLNSTRNPRLMRISPWSSSHGTRKMIWRSGSQILSMILCWASSACLARTGPIDSNTSRAAWWNSSSPGLRRMTSASTPSSFSSITASPTPTSDLYRT